MFHFARNNISYGSGPIEVFQSWPSVFNPDYCPYNVCSRLEFGGGYAVMHVSAITGSIFPNQTPMPLLLARTPPHVRIGISLVNANRAHVLVARTCNHDLLGAVTRCLLTSSVVIVVKGCNPVVVNSLIVQCLISETVQGSTGSVEQYQFDVFLVIRR